MVQTLMRMNMNMFINLKCSHNYHMDIECRFLILLIYDVTNPHSKTEIIKMIYPDKLLQ